MADNMKVQIVLDAAVLGKDEVKNLVAEIQKINLEAKKAEAQLKSTGSGINKAFETRGLLAAAGRFTEIHMAADLIRTSIEAIPKALTQVLETGIRINEEFESMKLGIASVMNAQLLIEDSQGRQLTGAEKYKAALQLSEEQFKKIRIESLKTQATTEELTKNFQTALSVAPQQGITNLETIRKLTVDITNAATAMNVEMHRVPVSIRAVLSGRGAAQNVVARNLGITLDEINTWKQAGTLIEELEKRLTPFSDAAKEAANSFKVMKSNVVEAFQIFSAEVTSGLFSQVKKSMNQYFWNMFDFDNMKFNQKLQPLIDSFKGFFDGIGEVFADAIDDVFNGIDSASNFVRDNEQAVAGTTTAWTAFTMSLKEAGRELVSTVTQTVEISTKLGLLEVVLGTVALALAYVADLFNRIWNTALLAIQSFMVGLDMIIETITLGLVKSITAAKYQLFDLMENTWNRSWGDKSGGAIGKVLNILKRTGEEADVAKGKISGLLNMSAEEKSKWDQFNAQLEARFQPKVSGAAFPKEEKSQFVTRAKLEKSEADRRLALNKLYYDLEEKLLQN